MPEQNTFARTLHDTGLATWFGGSLMGAVGLNGASQEVTDPADRTRVANAGWGRWTPVNAVAIAAHVLGGLQLTRKNKGRLVAQRGARSTNATKAGLTLAAIGATAYSRYLGQKVMDAEAQQASFTATGGGMPAEDATTPTIGTDPEAAKAQQQLKIFQWTIPALTGSLLALNAKAGEQQRPTAVLAGAVQSRLPDAGSAAPVLGGLAALALVAKGIGALRRRSRGKTARDIMSGGAECVQEYETLADAARKMAQLDVGALPICGADNRLKGMLTDRDIVVKAIASGRDASAITAGELAQGKPVTIGADDSVVQALHTMAQHKVRRLPVIDGHQLIGVVSQADIAINLDEDHVGELVESISLD